MDSSKKRSRSSRVGKILEITAVTVAGTVASVYVLNRLRRHRKTQALLDTLPPSTDVGIEDETAEPADDVYDPAEVTEDTGEQEPSADMTFDELYQLAQQRDLAGRSSMRKAELITALREATNR